MCIIMYGHDHIFFNCSNRSLLDQGTYIVYIYHRLEFIKIKFILDQKTKLYTLISLIIIGLNV